MVGIRSPDGLVVGLAPATLEFWVRFPNERNQGKQAHPVLKYRVPHGSQPRPGWAPDPLMVGIRSPDGLVVGSCTSHPGVLGSIPKREEPGKTGAPCVKVPGSSRVPVRDGQTHPHRPRLVVSHSTCPPLSSSPHAHSFVIGPAVIKHTFVSDCARQRARSTRFHTQRRSGSSFPWQSLALELIPSGSRPNN
jgi:hypothetical protein